MTAPPPRIVVAGIGNLMRGDDGVGPVVATRLAPSLPPPVKTLVGLGDPLDLIEVWDGADLAIVIDAVVSGSPPGTIHVLDADAPLPSMFRRLSTHLFSVAQVIDLGRVMGRMADRVVVIGIEAASMDQGKIGLTAEVDAAARKVVSIVAAMVDEVLQRDVGAPHA